MSNIIRRAAIVFVSAIAVACGSNSGSTDSTPAQSSSEITVTAAGSIPAGLPSHMEVGLFENEGASWMKGSGVPWDVRYAYFTYGWANNWGYGAHDGSWGLGFLDESSASGYLPAVQYYCMNGEAGGGEAQFLTKAQNATTMAEYFGDFKLLMQQVKAFGKPTMILMEADGFGFLQQQTGGNSSTYAAVAASGLPELAGLPNTVAGWGQAFLQLRKSVGATNAIMGIHVSAWASGEDVAYFSVTDPLQPQVDKVYSFLAPFGLAANATGATYDFLVGDPLDRDSDYYALVDNQSRWWDASDTASVNSESFNRYASWLSLWNAKAGKRWVLWQIPIGNSNALDVCNAGQPRQGYKDNRPEYFFGAESAQHLASWAQDGVIALLFGAGEGCQSSYENDTYTDGQLFLKSRVASFYAGGGLPLTGGGGGGGTADAGSGAKDSGATGTADAGKDSGAVDSGAPDVAAPPPPDSAQYSFETGTQGWATGSGVTGVASSSTRAFAGTHSLAVNVAETAAGTAQIGVAGPAIPAGAKVTFHVFIPSGSTIDAVQPFALQNASANWAWTGTWQGGLKANAWNTFTITVPTSAVTPLYGIGVEFQASAAWTGTLYVDSIAW
jgi:hypothetical protein